MVSDFDFLGTTDKPALLALSTIEWLETCRSVLTELGYKVHVADNHEDFQVRFHQVHYQVVVVEELFAANSITENRSLFELQNMQMNLRRHATVFLLGDSFQTMNYMQAYQQSVHAVVNRAELSLLSQLIEKVVTDTTQFLNTYRDTQERIVLTKRGYTLDGLGSGKIG